MGQALCERRAANFITMFGDELVAGMRREFTITEGDNWTLKSLCIGVSDTCVDVVGYATLRTADGQDIDVQLPTGCLFDPGYDDMEEQASLLVPLLAKPVDYIMQRFQEAELI